VRVSSVGINNMKIKMRKLEFVEDVTGKSIGQIISLTQFISDLFVLTDNGIWVLSEKNKKNATKKIKQLFFTKKYETK